jgi:hypothetical protein
MSCRLLFFCFANPTSQLFQQALLKENGEGDLQAAVALYEKIVGDATVERELQAKAQLHIGICWGADGENGSLQCRPHFFRNSP